LPKARNKLPLG
jgi:large subunit ribosomal protein L14